MGISSAMNAGVMGLGVNSSKLATISDNIANSETKGYKRATIEFNSLVLSERPTSYDAGGVRASTVRAIEDQGAIISTRNVMDLAISGRGFLPVADIAAVRRDDPLSLMLTRTGAFRPDYNGLMQTASGLSLLGWKADADGNFGNVVRDGVSGLSPVQIDALSLASERTDNITMKANLKASAVVGEGYTIPLEFFNSLGGASYLDMSFVKTADADGAATPRTGPQWTMSLFERPSGDYTGPNGAPDPTNPNERPRSEWIVEFDDQVDSNNVGGIKSFTRVALDAHGDPGYVADGAGGILAKAGVAAMFTLVDGTNADPELHTFTNELTGAVVARSAIPAGYRSAANDAANDYRALGTEVLYTLTTPATATSAAVYADVRAGGTVGVSAMDESEVTRLVVTGDAANGAYDPETGEISLTLTGDNGPLKLFVGRTGAADGLLQIDAGFQVLQVTKNGSPASSLVGIEMDETGLLDAIFDSGFRRTLYKIPVGHVQNPNGMKTLDGQAFALTRDSGNVYFYDAGSGPTGSLISSALEESTTDVAEELTQLIKTQRAYSSNAKIIQTVDEMLQETTNLKR